MRRTFTIIIIVLLGAYSPAFGQADPYLLAETEQFRFQSNFWINMHHFLFQKAKDLKRERNITEKEQELIDQLKGKDLKIYQQSLDYYTEQIIDKSHLFDEGLTKVKNYLGGFSGKRLPKNGIPDKALFKVLNDFSRTYEKIFWPLHDGANRARFNEHFDLLKTIEPKVLKELYRLTQNRLPKEKTLVDISAFANWAGAYTTNDPQHIILSSTRLNTLGTTWIEMVFHEASHGLVYNRSGLIGGTIRNKSKAMNKELPESLWHAVLFYLSGKVTANVLEEMGKTGHEMYMFRNGVFRQYHEVLNLYMPAYMDGTDSFEEVVEKILYH